MNAPRDRVIVLLLTETLLAIADAERNIIVGFDGV
jgi:hypothetical protein